MNPRIFAVLGVIVLSATPARAQDWTADADSNASEYYRILKTTSTENNVRFGLGCINGNLVLGVGLPHGIWDSELNDVSEKVITLRVKYPPDTTTRYVTFGVSEDGRVAALHPYDGPHLEEVLRSVVDADAMLIQLDVFQGGRPIATIPLRNKQPLLTLMSQCSSTTTP